MNILQMSFSAAVLIIAVVILRTLTLHKLPKKMFLALWGTVICRLLIPFSIPSRFSFYTGIDMVKRMLVEKAVKAGSPSSPVAITSGLNIANTSAAGKTVGIATATSAVSISPIEIAWFAGMCVCALFFIATYIKCRREFKTSLPVENNFAALWLREHSLYRPLQIRQSDRIKAPLTYGVFRPVILLPETIHCSDEAELKVILTHEFTHIRRFDTLIKLVLAAAVCVHWFNPFVWVMYVLANRDIELSCDETVVRTLGESMKSTYALTLIGWEERKSSLAPLISGFSKNAIEERIIAIMKIKKTSLIGMMLALTLVIGTVTVFATNAANAAEVNDPINTVNMLDQDAQTDSITVTGGTITLSAVNFGTHMDVELIKGGTFAVGREIWEKGDEIIFRISADEAMELNVGILPAENMDSGFGYNDYGQFIQKKVALSAGVQEISFIIPETGEYGISVQNIKNRSDQDSSAVSQPPETDAAEAGGQTTAEVGVSVSDAPDTITLTLEINRVFENPLTESAAQPWLDVPIKTDWPTRDMTFDRITFGSDRDWIVYRMGDEPDAEESLSDGTSALKYHLSPVKYTSPGSETAVKLPATAVDVIFYLDETNGVYRIDVSGDCEMTGREDSEGTLSGVLTQYGGPNVVAQEGDGYILWYYSPDNANQRIWFEVKNGALTKRMGIVDISVAYGAPVSAGAQAGEVASNGWVWPVEGCDTITSMFGRRVHPISGKTVESDHICISGNNADGAKVYAALAGTVLETGYDTEQGNYIIITHNNGIETCYRHLKKTLVSDGASVTAGDTIGTVGQTGRATGPHLAFGVYVDGEAVNPLDYLK